MDESRPEVIVASTLYLISGCIFDPSPCGCRVRAIVAHLERMMQMDGLDPVLRATAIQLHENWRRVADQFEGGAAADAGTRAEAASDAEATPIPDPASRVMH